MPEYRLGVDQSRGHHFKPLSCTTFGFTAGQSGTNTMPAVATAYEAALGSDVEGIGVGLPNDLGDPLNLMNALGSAGGRFIIFSMPMVPMGSGSIARLLLGQYDTQLVRMATRMVAYGWGATRNCAIRCGWEYNSGAGGSLSTYQWATGHVDPYSGQVNGIGQYKAAAAYIENKFRANGYLGYFSWCGGNNDTSALDIASAIPTHGDPATTIWEWDYYAFNPYNGSKDDAANSVAAADTIYNRYLAYCTTNNILMAHGEYGQTYKASSPYFINGVRGYFTYLYNKMRTNNTRVAYAVHYQQNQPLNGVNGNVLDEMHQLFGAGGWTGSHATIKGTGPYSVGASSLNTNGPANTQASMGNQLSAVSVSPTFWTPTADPNKIDILDEYLHTFGGSDPTKGAAGLAQPDPVVLNPATQPVILPLNRRHRLTVRSFG